jgi:hypothetical protein
MSHFNTKSLSFYGVAISSVLLLFKTVSAYGETNLKAQPNINGTYQFVQTENLPDCLQEKQLNLNIEQSGIYLFGNLAVQSESEGETGEIPLSGDFKENQIIMSGKGNVTDCNTGIELTIQGQPENQNLVGQIKDNAKGTEGAFVAKYQESKLSKSSQGH